MKELTELYTHHFGTLPTAVTPLRQAGSNRQYVRFEGPNRAIGVIGTDAAECHAFLYLARHFAQLGLPVPTIYAASQDEMRYLQEDLGNTALFDLLAPARAAGGAYSEDDIALLSRTVALLARVQICGAHELDFEGELLEPHTFDRRSVLFDLHYFKYSFLKTTDVPLHETSLEDDFERLADDLIAAGDGWPTAFLYRDFQARNIMMPDGQTPHLIDFQGGRRGPIHYDLAAFLWQASARYPDALRERLIDDYLKALRTVLPVATVLDEPRFRHELRLFALFRLMQVLGAYGLRGYVERKPHFLRSIPHAVASLRPLLDAGVADSYPTLRSILDRLTALPHLQVMPECVPMAVETMENKPKLVVRIFSFSYKRGIPEDTSGNGGGYVFDCRSSHNPGRYAPYKTLTGLDRPVIDFLEADGEITTFLESIYPLADFHCARYIERGFTDLMFSFGCTGGQHRSVYSAQHLAEHLNQKFGIEVRLVHREQGISQTFPAR